MKEEQYRILSLPSLPDLIESFLDRGRFYAFSVDRAGRPHYIEAVVHGISWIDGEDRKKLEIRGLTNTGRRYRAGIDFVDQDQSGIILDPDD